MQKFMFNQMFDEEIIERRRQEEAERLEAERVAAENAPPTFTVEVPTISENSSSAPMSGFGSRCCPS